MKDLQTDPGSRIQPVNVVCGDDYEWWEWHAGQWGVPWRTGGKVLRDFEALERDGWELYLQAGNSFVLRRRLRLEQRATATAQVPPLRFKFWFPNGATFVGRIRECVCGDLFVGIGKSKHCSERCFKKFYMRDFRNGKLRRKSEVAPQ